MKFASFAKFRPGIRGPGKEHLDPICRDNRKIEGKIPAVTGKSEKISVEWFKVLEWVDEKCRDFLLICVAQGKK